MSRNDEVAMGPITIPPARHYLAKAAETWNEWKVAPERTSLRELFRVHARFVGRSLFCLGVNDADLDDAVQEVFIVAGQRIHQYEERGAVRSWLWAICLNVSRSMRRRQRHVVPAEAGFDQPSQPSPEDKIDCKRSVDVALRALDQLTDEQRDVFVMYEIDQLEMREVAQVVGCPLQTAYWRLHAARGKLRELVQRTGGTS